jgi:hypothetical protein
MIFAVLSPFFKSSVEVEGFVETMGEEEYAAVLAKAKELLALELNDMSRGEQFLVEAQLHFLHQALQSYTDRVMNNLDWME